MALFTDEATVTYIGNGVASAFPIPFPYLDRDHISAWIDDEDLNPGTEFQITPPGSTGELTLPQPLASGAELKIVRLVPYTQPTDFVQHGIFDPKTLERSLDRIVMMIQQIKDGVGEIDSWVHGNLPGGSLHALVNSTTPGFMPSDLYNEAEAHFTQDANAKHLIEEIDGLEAALTSLQNTVMNLANTSAPIDSPTFTGDRPTVNGDPIQLNIDPVDWIRVANRPTTIEGYGILDAVSTVSPVFTGEPSLPVGTLLAGNNLAGTLAAKANSANVYTKGEVTSLLTGKADIGTVVPNVFMPDVWAWGHYVWNGSGWDAEEILGHPNFLPSSVFYNINEEGIIYLEYDNEIPTAVPLVFVQTGKDSSDTQGTIGTVLESEPFAVTIEVRGINTLSPEPPLRFSIFVAGGVP